MSIIQRLSALEILDSRGRPTVQATCELASGARGTVSVPSGASTGAAEAHELRDGDLKRYRGLGCRRAVANINQELHQHLAGQTLPDQQALDARLNALDGTSNKARLGANAILAVSLAFARAAAQEQELPLYLYFANLVHLPLLSLPCLTVNLFSGGKHAGAQVPIQDVLLVPLAASTIDESLATVFAVYQAAIDLSAEKYSARPLTADEGGLAPAFSSVTEMFDDAVTAIRRAGYQPGREVALAIDVASSQFYHDSMYHLGDEVLNSQDMIERINTWVNQYPIISIEDGLAENDWANWPHLRTRIADRALVLGDDLLCTNPERIRRAISMQAANALLLKVNQIGTLTEAAEAYQLARASGWHVTVSARSGETEDNWLADLAVGWAGNQIKIGSITQSERLAKYNRLLAIESESKLHISQSAC